MPVRPPRTLANGLHGLRVSPTCRESSWRLPYMYGTGQSGMAACSCRPVSGKAEGRIRNFRGWQMEMTAWALIVLLSVAFIAVITMAALSLTRPDGSE